MRRVFILLAILLIVLPAHAGPGQLKAQGAMAKCLPSVLHEVTITAPTGQGYDILPSWYADACLQNLGAQIDLRGGGSGGGYGLTGDGGAGDHVITVISPGDLYDLYSGNGGAGGSAVGGTVSGGTGYINGGSGTGGYGGGGGSAAILYDGELIAQAKGGGGPIGGGSSSGGVIYPYGGAAGGAQGGAGLDGYPGGNASVIVRYYTAP